MAQSTRAAEEDRFKVVLKFSEETGTYVARAPEIAFCISWGTTQEAALEGVREAIRSKIDTARACGDRVPEPALGGPPGLE